MKSPQDHRSFVAEIDPETRASLTSLRNGPALIRLAFLFSLIILLSIGILVRAPMWGLFVPVLGILLAFMFTLQHECTHKTPFQSTWINEWVGHTTGFLLVQPFLWFRYFHLAHHKFTNDPEKDPELIGATKPETLLAFTLHLSCIGYWKDKATTLTQNAFDALDQNYLPELVKPKVRNEARLLIFGYGIAALVLLLSPKLFWVWPGSLLFGFPVLRLYLLAEHGRCPKVANMFQNTRTTLTNAVMRLIAWNMPYHTEHHVYPSVPFHRLPELHELSRSNLQNVENGYTEFSTKYAKSIL